MQRLRGLLEAEAAEEAQLDDLAFTLQHALEVLSDDTITTLDDVERLYERIGTKRRSGIVETAEALRTEGLVLREARERRGAR